MAHFGRGLASFLQKSKRPLAIEGSGFISSPGALQRKKTITPHSANAATHGTCSSATAKVRSLPNLAATIIFGWCSSWRLGFSPIPRLSALTRRRFQRQRAQEESSDRGNPKG